MASKGWAIQAIGLNEFPGTVYALVSSCDFIIAVCYSVSDCRAYAKREFDARYIRVKPTSDKAIAQMVDLGWKVTQ